MIGIEEMPIELWQLVERWVHENNYGLTADRWKSASGNRWFMYMQPPEHSKMTKAGFTHWSSGGNYTFDPECSRCWWDAALGECAKLIGAFNWDADGVDERMKHLGGYRRSSEGYEEIAATILRDEILKEKK
jgi:hypothetical protein